MIREMCFGQAVLFFSLPLEHARCIVFEESHFACRSYSACDNAKKKRSMAVMMMLLPEVFNVGVSIQQQHWASRASGEPRKHRVICIKISFACKNYIQSHMFRWDSRWAYGLALLLPLAAALLFMARFLTHGWPCEENFILRNVFDSVYYFCAQCTLCACECVLARGIQSQQKLIEQSIHSNFICFRFRMCDFRLFGLEHVIWFPEHVNNGNGSVRYC